jgi:DNA-binding LacI/PurR family transcriptional regulator
MLVNQQPIRGPKRARAAKAAVRTLAKRIGPYGKLPTVNEMCAAFSISKVTLGSALKELEAEGIIKGKKGSGIFVSESVGQKTVAIVLGQDIFATGVSPVNRILLDRFRDASRTRRERFRCFIDLPAGDFLAHGIDSHRELQASLENDEIDCLIALGLASDKCQWLTGFGVPLIMTGVKGERPVEAAGRVLTHYGPMAGSGVQALLEQGARRVGLITPLGYLRSEGGVPDDLESYRAALAAAGAAQRNAFVWDGLSRAATNGALSGESMEEAGYRAVRELCARCDGEGIERPDALVILDDMVCRGALVAAQEVNLSLGHNLRIASHANRGSTVLGPYASMLTLMQFDPDEIASKLLSAADQILTGATTLPDQIVGITLIRPGEESSGQAPAI